MITVMLAITLPPLLRRLSPLELQHLATSVLTSPIMVNVLTFSLPVCAFTFRLPVCAKYLILRLEHLVHLDW